MENKCTCDNPNFGFNCMCDWMRDHPGTIEYSCEFCGMYTASAPRCSSCENDGPITAEEEEFADTINGNLPADDDGEYGGRELTPEYESDAKKRKRELEEELEKRELEKAKELERKRIRDNDYGMDMDM